MKTENTKKKGESAATLAERVEAAKKKQALADADASRLKAKSRAAKAALKKARKASKTASKAARAAKKLAEEARLDYKKALTRAEKARDKAAKKIAKAKPPAPITTPRKSSRPRNVARRPRVAAAAASEGVDFEASFSDTDLETLAPQ